ncbi:ATP-binding cassette domain-containing protein [Gordonia hongkongensis]|uniref:ATP-binding cassette domain-containing protein n=1 Tax=Gordonia hongkongensis TaxID=1701090 RepID=UPI003D71AD66
MVEALEVANLSKSFGGQRALADVSLSLGPGEIRALVGQNGCGKSTLIKVLAGYHEPDPHRPRGHRERKPSENQVLGADDDRGGRRRCRRHRLLECRRWGFG